MLLRISYSTALLMSSKIKKAIITTLIFTLIFSSFYIPTRGASSSSHSSRSPVKSDDLPPTIYPLPQQNLTIQVDREVHSNNFLYSILTDKIYLKNKEIHPFNGFRLFFTTQNWKKLEGVTVKAQKNGDNQSLQWTYFFRKAGYLGLKIHFPWYIEKEESINITFQAHIPKIGEFEAKDGKKANFHYTFSTAPRLLHNVKKASSHFIAPWENNKTKTNYSAGTYKFPLLFNSSVPAAKIANEFKLSWEVGTLPIRISYFERDVSYKLSHSLFIKERYVLSSISPTGTLTTGLKVENLKIGVLKGARNITIRDPLGKRKINMVGESKESTLLKVNFRVPLRQANRYEFTVSYSHNGSVGQYISETHPDDPLNFGRKLNFPFGPLVNASAETSLLRFSIPSALSLRLKTPKDSLEGIKKVEKRSNSFLAITTLEETTWIADDLLPYQKSSMEWTVRGYPLAYLRIFGRLSIFVLFVFILILGTVTLFSLREKEIRITPDQFKRKRKESLLRGYIKRWERFVALEDRVDEELADAVLGEGKRGFKELSNATDKLEDRREDLYGGVGELKQDPTLKQIIRKLERAGSELATIRTMVLQRWRQYIQKGKVKKDFRPYVRDLLSSMNNFRLKRDRHLNALKDYLLVNLSK